MATTFKNPIFLKRLRFVSDSPDDKVCVKQDRKSTAMFMACGAQNFMAIHHRAVETNH